MRTNKILLSISACVVFLNSADHIDTFSKNILDIENKGAPLVIAKKSQKKPVVHVTKNTKTKEKQIELVEVLEKNDLNKTITINNKSTNSFFNITDENKRFSDVKISSIYSLNGTKFVVFHGSIYDGRYSENDFMLGYKIEKINLNTKTVTLSREIDKSNIYYLNICAQGISWKKNN